MIPQQLALKDPMYAELMKAADEWFSSNRAQKAMELALSEFLKETGVLRYGDIPEADLFRAFRSRMVEWGRLCVESAAVGALSKRSAR